MPSHPWQPRDEKALHAHGLIVADVDTTQQLDEREPVGVWGVGECRRAGETTRRGTCVLDAIGAPLAAVAVPRAGAVGSLVACEAQRLHQLVEAFGLVRGERGSLVPPHVQALGHEHHAAKTEEAAPVQPIAGGEDEDTARGEGSERFDK